MTESTPLRSHRREQAHHRADDLLDDLFEDLDSGLRTTPLLPRQWGSRFQSPLYPSGSATPPRRWGAWLAGAGVMGALLAGWGLWHSYSRFVTQVMEPDFAPLVSDYPNQGDLGEPTSLGDSLETANPEAVPSASEPATTATAAADPPPATSETTAETTSSVTAKSVTPASVAPRPISRPAAPVAYAPPEPEVIRYFAPPPQQAHASVTQPLPMKLVGTVSGPGTPMALIVVDDVVREVPVGETVLGAWRVQSVTRDGVTLNNGRQGLAMHLGLGQGQ